MVAPPTPSQQLLRWFRWDHLPTGPARQTSQMFHELARDVEDTVPDGPEKTVALRKLLEAKDAAVRAVLSPDVEP